MIFVIYEKLVHDSFCGDGLETIVADKANNKILAHTRGRDDGSVVEDFKGPLKGKSLEEVRGKGWRKVTGQKLDLAQSWAREVIN